MIGEKGCGRIWTLHLFIFLFQQLPESSHFCLLCHWVPRRHFRWGINCCRRVRSNSWGMLTCAVVEIADGPNITSGYWSLRFPEWNEIHFLTETILKQASSKTKTCIVTHLDQSMNTRMPCETSWFFSINPSKHDSHRALFRWPFRQQYTEFPTWNNQR